MLVFKRASSSRACLSKPLDKAPKYLAPFQMPVCLLIIETDFDAAASLLLYKKDTRSDMQKKSVPHRHH